MNLLAFIVMVICVAVVAIVVTIPNEVWAAIAERIRNPPPPRPTYLEELHRHWEALERDAWKVEPCCVNTPPGEEHHPSCPRGLWKASEHE